MEHRTLVKIMATKHCLVFRTISRKNKSPYAFYILRDSFEELENLLDPSMTVNDIRSFAELRRNISKKTVQIRFSWLSGSDDLLTGRAETVTIPYDELIRFARKSADGEQWSTLSIQERAVPRLVFHSEKNLRAAVSNRKIRRKLSQCLRDSFHWKDSETVDFYDDFLPYSFSFRETRNGQPGICGGLIFHGPEDLSKARYSIHT